MCFCWCCAALNPLFALAERMLNQNEQGTHKNNTSLQTYIVFFFSHACECVRSVASSHALSCVNGALMSKVMAVPCVSIVTLNRLAATLFCGKVDATELYR